jgi:hypothetical protein
MSAFLQISNLRYAVIQLSSTRSSHERLILAYPTEETLRHLLADSSAVDVGISSREEAVSAAGAAMTKAVAPSQADDSRCFHVEAAQEERFQEQLAHRMVVSSIRRWGASIVQLGIATALFIFYSKNIVSATLRAVLAGSL